MIGKTLLAIVATASAIPAMAEDRGDPNLIVTGAREVPRLDRTSGTGSRLGLTVMETPATVETLDQTEIQFRGLRTAREAYAEVAGAIAGNVPGNPAVVMMRGFAGSAISILQDGVRVSTSTVVQRDTNSWHFDRVEVIKGPASVLYGEGALGGVINKVTRKPSFDGDRLDMLLSYGSFDTVMAAGGVNYRLSDTVAVRADASRLRSDSLYDVKNNATRSSGLTGSLLFQPSAYLSILIAVDHYNDRYDSSYQGVPLIPRAFARDASDAVRSTGGLVIDKALRRINYNPRGSYSGANETTLRSRIDWRLGGGWSIGTDLSWYDADRAFLLNDTQTFAAPTAAFPNGSFRRTYQRFYHDHRFWNVRSALANESVIAGLRNRFTLGAEYNHTDFASLRQSAPASRLQAVDPYAPVVGDAPMQNAAYTTGNVNFDSTLRSFAVFAEDALNLTPRWLLVGGVRYDGIDLSRTVTDFNVTPNRIQTANPTYHPVSWRIGSTYAVTPDFTLYGQYTTAAVPVSSMLLQSIVNSAFRLTRGSSYEGGFKLSTWGKRLTVTGAAYHIAQNDILTRDPIDPSLTVQGGRQSSRGVELSIDAAASAHLTLGGAFSYVKARYDELIEAGNIDRSGNRPINVPSTTASGHLAYSIPGLPVTASGFVRHVSGFYTDTANSIVVRGRTTIDAAVAWAVTKAATMTLRGRNLTNAVYGEYSGYPTTNVYVGAPRSVEVSLSAHF